MRRFVLSTLIAWALLAASALAQEGNPNGAPANGGANAQGVPGSATLTGGPLDPTTPTARPAARVYSPEDQARRARVMARVGPVTITVGEVEDAINAQSPFLRVRYRDRAQLRSFVDSMIRFELLARAAERAGIGREPEVVRVGKQNAVQQLIRRDFDERVTPESVPEQDVRAYYEGHPEEFSRDELRRAAHIQLSSREDAERLLPQAREADARVFRELARDNSVDAETRLRGGDLRYFDREGGSRNGQDTPVHRALAAAAFGLAEVGEVAGPVQVDERWSLVKLTGRRPPENRSFEQASPSIRLRLWRQRRQSSLEELVARLRREANVQPNYDSLRSIQLDPAPREDEDEHGSAPRVTPVAEPASDEGANAAPAEGEEAPAQQ
jgi:peptidyl-prolyl cis-trans isomerase C